MPTVSANSSASGSWASIPVIASAASGVIEMTERSSIGMAVDGTPMGVTDRAGRVAFGRRWSRGDEAGGYRPGGGAPSARLRLAPPPEDRGRQEQGGAG